MLLSIIQKNIFLTALCFCALIVSGCNENKNTIKIGTMAGPETELAEIAAQVAEKQYGLPIKIITFTNYLQPNAALNDGSLDANVFQHKPYLDEQTITYHYKLAIVGKTFVYPMGLYSAHHHSLAELPDNSQVALPNDPTNEGRALLLLQKAGLIKLLSTDALEETPQEISSNPKHLRFVELDAAHMARAYKDIDLVVINTNYAIPAGLYPSRDALFVEDKDSPYANLIVVRQDDINQPWVKPLVSAFHSQEVIDKANELFEKQAVTAFTLESGV